MGEKQGHTPGPWHVCDPDVAVNAFIVVDEGNISIADCGCFSGNREANARLIAAAPDLLDALKMVQRSTEWPTMESETQDAVSAAISRATGEDSPANEGEGR